MPYRSDNAQAIHGAMLRFIKKPLALEDFQKVLSSTGSADALQEPSINGHSHLHDALHLPFAIHDTDHELASTQALALMRRLFAEASQHPEALRYLLCSPNNDGFTPLHEALVSAKPEIVQAYLAKLTEAVSTQDTTRCKHQSC